jgi:hypothetical protein
MNTPSKLNPVQMLGVRFTRWNIDLLNGAVNKIKRTPPEELPLAAGLMRLIRWKWINLNLKLLSYVFRERS